MTHHMLPPVASKTWLEGGRKLLALWKVSPSTKFSHPGWWIPIPSWHSSLCPSSPSSSTYPTPCALHCFLVPIGSQCLPTCLPCLGCCFLPDLPFLIGLLSGGDYRSIPRCLVCRVDLQDVVCSSSLIVAPTLSCIGWATQLLRPRFAPVSLRHWRGSLSPVNSSHRSHLDHTTLCLRSSCMANHSFPTNGTNWWCTKIISELIILEHSNGYLKNKKPRTKQRAPMGCWPKTF